MLYDNVRRMCEQKGISVSMLEKKMEFSNGSISKWNDNEPGIRKVQKVADYFGVAIEDLLEQEVREVEIRKLEIDFNKGILKINGKDYTDRKVVVSLPGEDGWPLAILYQPGNLPYLRGEHDRLTVSYEHSNSMPE